MIYNICKTNLPYRKVSKIVELFANEHPECNIPINIINGFGKHNAMAYFDSIKKELGLNLYDMKSDSLRFPAHLKVPSSFATILIHELFHYKQFCDGDLYTEDNKTYYKKDRVIIPFLISMKEYWKLSWEADANERMAYFYHRNKNEIKQIAKLPNCNHLATRSSSLFPI